jgi:hypothetical protein
MNYFLFLSLDIFCQVIDQKQFDEKLFEKILFQRMIDFRQSIGADSLIWCEALHTHISQPNTTVMMQQNRLYHPDEGDIWKEGHLKQKIADEMVRKQKVKLLISPIHDPIFSSYEIAARIGNYDIVTYQDLADRAIIGWSKSEGHKDVETMPMFIDGAYAMASCSVKMSKDKRNYFIEFDFSIPYCIREKLVITKEMNVTQTVKK